MTNIEGQVFPMRSAMSALASVILGALILTSCAITPSAATINNQTISVSSLNAELGALTSNKAFVSQVEASSQPVFGAAKGSYAASFTAQILNRRISVDLVEQALAKVGVTVSPSADAIGAEVAAAGFGGAKVFSEFPASYRVELAHDTAAIDELQAYLTKTKITQQAINSYYNANKATLVEYCVSQILVGTQAQAASLASQIQAGANFASVAASSSQDTTSASSGGAIGCGRLSDFTTAFGASYSQLVGSLALNTVSSPLQISKGWVIIEVTTKAVPPEATDVAVVVGSLLGSQAQADLGHYVQRFAKASKLSVNPIYGELSLKGGNVAVLPPTKPSAKAQNYFRTPAP